MSEILDGPSLEDGMRAIKQELDKKEISSLSAPASSTIAIELDQFFLRERESSS